MDTNNNRRSIGSIPLDELREQMRAAFSRMSGEKVISCLLKYQGKALLSREMAHDMLRDDVVSYDDLGLEYRDDYFPGGQEDAGPIDLGIEV